jgi:hypothetical protein
MPPRASRDDFGEFRTNSAARIQAPKRLDIRDRELGSQQSREQKALRKHEQAHHTKQQDDLEQLASISNDPHVLDLLSKMNEEVYVESELQGNESTQQETKFLSHYRVSLGR